MNPVVSTIGPDTSGSKEDEPSRPFSLTEVYTKPTFWSIAGTYLEVGFLHIVPKGVGPHTVCSRNIFDFDATEAPDPSSHNVYDRAFGNPCFRCLWSHFITAEVG